MRVVVVPRVGVGHNAPLKTMLVIEEMGSHKVLNI